MHDQEQLKGAPLTGVTVIVTVSSPLSFGLNVAVSLFAPVSVKLGELGVNASHGPPTIFHDQPASGSTKKSRPR